ncbi:unnamed protein product [Spirodela intermedia]|uniref:Uncharacterized protein n=1 Tax=Spirodela intermedia TaxID=51605 RepID=A0A7I8IBQ3_SPIIN|nr:unnamed protein product [Spirodela intermedia]CAA6655165.1 unnamed protein product [Spirodela intermedia]CAA6675702.1 unnamed protein product [Spirodela intermedia]
MEEGRPAAGFRRACCVSINELGFSWTRRPARPASGLEAQLESSREQGLERLAWINRGTCAPLPFHVTGGQLVVGQGVVVHTRGLCLES